MRSSFVEQLGLVFERAKAAFRTTDYRSMDSRNSSRQAPKFSSDSDMLGTKRCHAGEGNRGGRFTNFSENDNTACGAMQYQKYSGAEPYPFP
jgi:hypothetical protein